MSSAQKNICQILADIKEAWSKSSNLHVFHASNRIPDECTKTLATNPPPISHTCPEFQSLMNIEWRKSTELQLQKDPTLESKRFCTIVDFKDFKMGFVYMGPYTNFPEHAHTPEEIYHVVAGKCLRISGSINGINPVEVGDIWFHESKESHGLKTEDSSVLIAWAWFGNLDGPYYFCDAPKRIIDCNYVSK